MAKNENNQEKSTPTGESDIRKVVENANAADENLKADKADTDDEEEITDDDDNSGDDDGDDSADDSDSDDSDTDTGDDEEEDDDSDDDSKPDEKKDPKSRRFSQFSGDGSDGAYLSNLEKGYENSSKEAIKLNGELRTANDRVDAVMKAVAANPELAKALNSAIGEAGASGADAQDVVDSDNPFVRNLKSEWQDKSQKEIATFIEANPEVDTDPEIKAEVMDLMHVLSNRHYKKTGRLMSGGEAMAQAFRTLGLENKLEKQNLADGAKKIVTNTRSRGKSKKSTGQKASYTPEQIAMAQSMGKDQAWLEKNAK